MLARDAARKARCYGKDSLYFPFCCESTGDACNGEPRISQEEPNALHVTFLKLLVTQWVYLPLNEEMIEKYPEEKQEHGKKAGRSTNQIIFKHCRYNF